MTFEISDDDPRAGQIGVTTSRRGEQVQLAHSKTKPRLLVILFSRFLVICPRGGARPPEGGIGDAHREPQDRGTSRITRRPGDEPDAHGTWSAPCATDPTAWDLDAGTLAAMVGSHAANACTARCWMNASRCAMSSSPPPTAPIAPSAIPNGVIWAGIAYSESGVPLDGRGLRLYAARAPARTPTADHHCAAPNTFGQSDRQTLA